MTVAWKPIPDDQAKEETEEGYISHTKSVCFNRQAGVFGLDGRDWQGSSDKQDGTQGWVTSEPQGSAASQHNSQNEKSNDDAS